jgi:hypothetical protein
MQKVHVGNAEIPFIPVMDKHTVMTIYREYAENYK